MSQWAPAGSWEHRDKPMGSIQGSTFLENELSLHTFQKKNSTPLGSFCLPKIAQDRPSTCLCFPLPLAYQSHIKIVLKGTEIHMTKPHHKTVLRWCILHLSTLTAGNFTTTYPKVSRFTWANNFTRKIVILSYTLQMQFKHTHTHTHTHIYIHDTSACKCFYFTFEHSALRRQLDHRDWINCETLSICNNDLTMVFQL